jgi:hypothetical protein
MLKKLSYVLASVILLILIICTLIFYKYINVALANSQIEAAGLKLLNTETNLKDELSKNYSIQPGWFGANVYVNEKEGVQITFSGFPDVTSKWVLTAIETTNPKHSIYNIHVGDRISEAAKILKSKNYKSGENTNNHFIFQRNRIKIILYVNMENKVEKIYIGLQSTNLQNVQF